MNACNRIVFLSTLFFISLIGYSQKIAGAIRLHLSQKTKTGPVPFANQTMTLVLNDTLVFPFTTDGDGSFVQKNLTSGNYTVAVKCENCLTTSIVKVIVGEGKTAYL